MDCEMESKEIFWKIEDERKKLAVDLLEDVAQLICIARMANGAGKENQGNHYLTLALNKVKRLSSDLRPEQLEMSGLHAALNDFFMGNLPAQLRAEVTIAEQLPGGMDEVMVRGLFRLIQAIVKGADLTLLHRFRIAVNRESNFIVLMISFDTAEKSFEEMEEFRTNLGSSIQATVYLFKGSHLFRAISNAKAEINIYLDEGNVSYQHRLLNNPQG